MTNPSTGSTSPPAWTAPSPTNGAARSVSGTSRPPLNAQGDRRFEINGRPLLIRGAGWASDLFLRTQPQRLADQLRYVRDLGLNTLRLEGKQEDHELVELADRMGIMVLPGWECCTKWEKYGTWTDSDLAVAAASARSEARRLRDHPSVIGFLVGSDAAPPAAVERAYLDAFRSVDWQTPIISSAKRLSSPELGTSGMKMDGPYWWVPPNYWYNDRLGGAFGFASEVGPGPTIPELDSLRRYLSPAEIEDLWRHPDRRHYHLAQKEVFGTLTLFARAMNLRHGPPRDRDDFLRKAQLMNYEANRAQMEAFGRDFSDPARPATGVIYWMLNNAWPTLYWHLWDYNLAPAGSYFGAKNALRPLHVQYSYDDRSAVIVNTGPKDARGLTVRSTVFSVDGTVLADETVGGRDVGSGSALRALTVPRSQGTHLLRLLLLDSEGRQVDRNVYWLSDRVDELDYANSTWWHTPITSGADYTGLQSMPEARIATSVRTEPGPDGTLRTVVTIRNPAGSGPAAFFLRANLRRGPDGDQVTPVRWSDNYVTLWPGESTELRAEYRAGDLGGARPHVEVTGWNTPRVG
nr:hypothetical protein GCM10020241_39650 [Streptoalloteichus tenebrarius]